MKKIFVIFLLLFLFTGCSHDMSNHSEIIEEVEPIREDNQIIGINYYITLPKDFSGTNISTHIIDSIFHYKSLDDMNVFFVSVILNNQSSFDYQLNQVSVRRENVIMNRYAYDIHFLRGQTNTFSFSLTEPLTSDCTVELKLLK